MRQLPPLLRPAPYPMAAEQAVDVLMPPRGVSSVRPRVLTAFRARGALPSTCSLRRAPLRACGGPDTGLRYGLLAI